MRIEGRDRAFQLRAICADLVGQIDQSAATDQITVLDQLLVGHGRGFGIAQSILAERAMVSDEPCCVLGALFGTTPHHGLAEIVIGIRLVAKPLARPCDRNDARFRAVHEVRKGSQCAVGLNRARNRHPCGRVWQAGIHRCPDAFTQTQTIAGIAGGCGRNVLVPRRRMWHQFLAAHRVLREPACGHDNTFGSHHLYRARRRFDTRTNHAPLVIGDQAAHG